MKLTDELLEACGFKLFLDDRNCYKHEHTNVYIHIAGLRVYKNVYGDLIETLEGLIEFMCEQYGQQLYQG